MRIAITGGSGFIGTNLASSYAFRGHDVLNLDLKPPRDQAQASMWRQVDVLDHENLARELVAFDPQRVLHFAARTDLEGQGLSDYRANTDGVANMVAAASMLPRLERIVFASSMLVCPLGYLPRDEHDVAPNTRYGESKVIGERLVRASGSRISWTIVRPTSLWGPWFDVPYRAFFDHIASGTFFYPRGRRIVRSYGFIGNAVQQIDRLSAAPKAVSKTFYLADYQPTDLRQWAELIRESLGARAIREAPLAFLRAVAMGGDLLKALGLRNPPLTSFRLKNLLTNAIYDLEPTRAVCGHVPFDLAEGVRLTAEWLKTRPSV
jgi:nucleoside-diphosphate-sugar epimerase